MVSVNRELIRIPMSMINGAVQGPWFMWHVLPSIIKNSNVAFGCKFADVATSFQKSVKDLNEKGLTLETGAKFVKASMKVSIMAVTLLLIPAHCKPVVEGVKNICDMGLAFTHKEMQDVSRHWTVFSGVLYRNVDDGARDDQRPRETPRFGFDFTAITFKIAKFVNATGYLTMKIASVALTGYAVAMLGGALSAYLAPALIGKEIAVMTLPVWASIDLASVTSQLYIAMVAGGLVNSILDPVVDPRGQTR